MKTAVSMSGEAGLVLQAADVVSTGLVPVDRRLARRNPQRVGDSRSQTVTVLAPDSDNPPADQVQTLASLFVSNSDVGFSERLDVAGQYWFYATMLTANYHPMINVWA